MFIIIWHIQCQYAMFSQYMWMQFYGKTGDWVYDIACYYIKKSPRYTGGDFMFMYRFIRRRPRRPRRLPNRPPPSPPADSCSRDNFWTIFWISFIFGLIVGPDQ